MAYQYALADARWSINKENVAKVEQDYEKLLTAKERETYAKEAEALDPIKMMNAKADEVLLKSLTLIASLGDHDSEYELAMHHLNGGMGLTRIRKRTFLAQTCRCRRQPEGKRQAGSAFRQIIQGN